jgi:hypothetical protein
MSDHELNSEHLDREVADLEKKAEKVQDDIDGTRSDWKAKKDDPAVPGAMSEGDDPLDPTAGDTPGETDDQPADEDNSRDTPDETDEDTDEAG